MVARKQLHDGPNHRERAILELLQKLKHPNIVEFLGSYSHHQVHNLLFKYTPMDLKEFLQRSPHINSDDVYVGIYGMADALSKIHNFTFQDEHVAINQIGLHHDLRPANILVDGNVFLIADFGLSQMKSPDQTSKTRLKGGHDDYLGPESFNDVDWTNGAIGRALDVWAFGCIVAEMVTYIDGKSVKDFYTQRIATHRTDYPITDHAFHLNGYIRPAVRDWLANLAANAHDNQINDLVTLSLEMLEPNPSVRLKITSVVARLSDLAIQSRNTSIERLFERFNQGFDNSSFVLCLILEHMRFAAWTCVLSQLRKDMTGVSDPVTILDHLAGLQKALKTANLCVSKPDDLGDRCLILRDVQTLVDKVWKTLRDQELSRLHQTWSDMVGSIDDDGILKAIAEYRSKSERYREVGATAAMKYMARVITHSIRQGTRSRYIELGCVDLDDSGLKEDVIELRDRLVQDKSKSMASYIQESGETCKVLVEWKPYDSRWKDGRGSDLRQTMDDLVNLLDPDVTPRQGAVMNKELDCVGYIHEPRKYRFGFLYKLRGHGIPEPSLANDYYSLNNVLRITDPEDGLPNAQRPNLGDIFTLAKDISSCILALHQAGWLHKSISSHQILVFTQSADTAHNHLSTAVLVGFNESRQEISTITLGPTSEFPQYQHPLYQERTTFRQSFDYFSLGIVLLELGLWCPISNLKAVHSELSPDECRRKLIGSYVPMLGERIGVIYQDAVNFCLDAEGVIKTERIFLGSRAPQELFWVRVVEPLSQCMA